MFQPIYDIEGGPGWIISGRTLLPEINDHTLFREAFEQDNLSVPLELLWTGYPEQAFRLLEKKSVSTRQQALIADCFRGLERYPEAEQIYRALLKDITDPRLEATLHQHLGKIQAIRFSSSEKIMTLDDILYTTLVKFSNGAQK
ncbi:hypothetical protein [Rothia amarae]|uniref:hypothetical protein n=1 Tax=Rothia amarae TaxID=169480 RepID=UPI0031D7D61F